MVVKWEFFDPTNSTTVAFEINPSEGGAIAYKKNITTQSTLAHDGKTLVFEGAQVPPEINFSGTILTETQYNQMVTWFNKKHQMQLTDDLSRVMMVFITEFTPVRERARNYPWKHSYTCKAVIVDWP